MDPVLIRSRMSQGRTPEPVEVIVPPEAPGELAISRTVTPRIDEEKLDRLLKLERLITHWRSGGVGDDSTGT